MGSGTSKAPVPTNPSPDEEELEDDEQTLNNEPPVLVEKIKSDRLITPPRKVVPKTLIHDFSQSTTHDPSVPKTNISRQSDIFEAASKGDVDGLTALLASNPALLWATTTADLNYYM